MTHYLNFRAAQVVAFIASIVPIGFSSWVARRIGDLCYWLMRKRRKVALSNIRRAFGRSLTKSRQEQLIRSAFQNAALSILELFLVRKIKKEAAKRFIIRGREHLDAAFSRGKGAVLVASHLGSWEYLACLSFLTPYPWSPVVKAIKNPHLKNQRKCKVQRIQKIQILLAACCSQKGKFRKQSVSNFFG